MLWFAIIFLATQTLAREIGPVLIWGNYGTVAEARSGVARLTAQQFAQQLQKLLTSRPVILLFTEPSLSIEDFNYRNNLDANQKLTFPHLFNISHTPGFLYLPHVERALRVVHQLTQHGYSLAQYDEDSPSSVSAPTILVGRLREPTASESRQTLLRGHDEHMHQLTQDALQRYGQVVVIYTGRHASYVPPNRHKRQAEEEEEAGKDEGSVNELVMSDDDREKTGAKIYVVTSSPIEYRNGNVTMTLSQVIYASKDGNKTYIALDVKFKQEAAAISLDWVFKSPSELSGWSLEYVKVEGVKDMKMRPHLQIHAPGGYSYFCTRDIIFSGVDKEGTQHTLTLSGIQVQPRVQGGAFGPATDCIPYFSEPIWSGIIISSLLLTVVVLAITMLLDIHTNDRFDDSKGKFLTITNAE